MQHGVTVLTAVVVAALAALTWPGRPALGCPSHSRRGDGDSRGSAAVRAVARLRPRARVPDRTWVAEFAEVAAVGLDAGLDLPVAALASARAPNVLTQAPWLAEQLRTAVDDGRGVSMLLEGAPADLGAEARRDLCLLVAAWRLAERVGSAASSVTASAASSVRERRAAADRTDVVVAGPRASMLLLSALPLAGPTAGLLVGLTPATLYDSTAARVLGCAGVLLTALGWWWSRGLLRRARRPGRTDEAPT